MMTSDDKVGGWVKKGQKHDDVILECPLRQLLILVPRASLAPHMGTPIFSQFQGRV